ncbi:MAG TPA: SUMF1/EgtB/PvdO family nonheme iron enzyme [Candidatus Cloacimonadota bacterium]|nr:SUMF1/EgtB/PvdO family nonheme iron enzyme [Candidatus Cloacimonadota bacterium]
MTSTPNLSSFRITETIQESRRYVIYKAEAFGDGSRVVIKTTAGSASHDPILNASLKQEALAGMKLSSQYIRGIVNCFEDAGQNYLIAEYADGISLGQLLLNNPSGVSFELGLLWARNIVEALVHAARQNVIHVNLNPYNVIIDPVNHLKVIGFGKERKAWKHSEGNFKFHFPILYIPAEEYRGSLIHANSDLYSWAVLTYQILTGNIPWRVDSFSSPEEQKEQCLTRAVVQPNKEKIPDWLYSLILDCLKMDPADRPRNPGVILQALLLEGNYTDYLELEELAQNEEDKALWLKENQAADSEMDSAESPEPEIEAETVPEKPEDSITEEVTSFEVLHTESGYQETETPEPDLCAVTLEPEMTEQEETQEADQSESALQTIMVDDSEEPQGDPYSKPETEQMEDTKPDIGELPESIDQPGDTGIFEAESIPLLTPEDNPKLEIPPATKEPDKPAQPKTLEDPTVLPAQQQSIGLKEDTRKIEIGTSHVSKPKINYAPKSTPKEDLTDMQKAFRVLMIICLVIVLFLMARYFLTRTQTGFEHARQEQEQTEPMPEVKLLKDNRPLTMIRIPADTLVMGNIGPEADDDEFPLLTIGLGSFLISTTEVTQEEWMMIYSENPSQFKGDNLPVENVSFYDVVDYCNAKSIKDDLTPAYDVYGSEVVCDFEADGYRLPTEAEWEMAGKAGKGKLYHLYSGSEVAEDIAWYNANSGARTHNVGSKNPNLLGLYDLSGNVYEWVWNWYAPYTFKVPNLNTGPQSGTDKVIRGGSWYHPKHDLRISNRDFLKPFAKNGYTGFRVVRSK